MSANNRNHCRAGKEKEANMHFEKCQEHVIAWEQQSAVSHTSKLPARQG